MSTNERVIVYVDGFNLYFGLKEKGWRRFYWLNIQRLALNLLKPNQRLVRTKYFTSRISGPPAKQARQAIYIEALETLPEFDIFYGQYHKHSSQCPRCGASHDVPHEKMTDVNIAVQLLKDAFQNNFDVAILISADSDLVAPVEEVRRLFPAKRTVVAFPPNRYSAALSQVSGAFMHIHSSRLAKSLFPPTVVKSNGIALDCPPEWR